MSVSPTSSGRSSPRTPSPGLKSPKLESPTSLGLPLPSTHPISLGGGSRNHKRKYGGATTKRYWTPLIVVSCILGFAFISSIVPSTSHVQTLANRGESTSIHNNHPDIHGRSEGDMKPFVIPESIYDHDHDHHLDHEHDEGDHPTTVEAYEAIHSHSHEPHHHVHSPVIVDHESGIIATPNPPPPAESIFPSAPLAPVVHTKPVPKLAAEEAGRYIHKGPKEAYVTFLSSAKNEHYFQGVRLLLFQLLHDPLTRDPQNRDFVVITTEKTPIDMVNVLKSEGAIIEQHDLIKGLPMGSEYDGVPYDQLEDHRWTDVYTKLGVFKMVNYDRVLLLDGDIMLMKPLHGIWNDRNSWAPSGLAGCADWWGTNHPSPVPDGGYLNTGFLLLQPSVELFEKVMQTRDYDPHEGDQGLLNKYFSREGMNPWAPLDHIFTSKFPNKNDISVGVKTLHEHFWEVETWERTLDREVTEAWKERMGRMEGYWLGRRIAAGGVH